MKIDKNDIRIEAVKSDNLSGGMETGQLPVGVKVTHISTGISATSTEYRHQYLNKDAAILGLIQKLKNREL